MAEAATTVGTDYTVLEQVLAENGEVLWRVAGEATSPTRSGAAKAVAGEGEGIFKPVPKRSWTGSFKHKQEKVTKTVVDVVDD